MTWPKLSETLTGPVAPDRCQSCGVEVSDADRKGVHSRRRWIECDDADQPTRTLVVLCAPCSTRIIEPHPRLYQGPLDAFEPHAGSAALCLPCVHRVGNLCGSPRAKGNGGAGVLMLYPPPTRAHMCGTRNGRRTGWTATLYTGEPTACDARLTADDPLAAPPALEDAPHG